MSAGWGKGVEVAMEWQAGRGDLSRRGLGGGVRVGPEQVGGPQEKGTFNGG